MLKHWEAEQKEEWDKIVAGSPDGGLLQSWEWGEFQESLGNAVYNVSDEEENWFAQCIQLKAGSQWILSIPRGPVYSGDFGDSMNSFGSFMAQIKKFAEELRCFLVRFDPPWIPGRVLQQNFDFRIVKAQKERNPVHTLIIDTKNSEQELFMQMKPKHRYNIRLAEKKEVEVYWSQKPEDALKFCDLMEKTGDRQGFGIYDKQYYKKMMEVLGSKNMLSFVFATVNSTCIASLMIAFFDRRAYYLHGASDYEHRSLMAPHLLQWEVIKEAKKRGLRYDMWGVSADPPANEQEKRWKGVTRFKKGFAPEEPITEYAGSYEMPISNFWYTAYKLRQIFKK